jgi:predicted Ser/Thr protein kinase
MIGKTISHYEIIETLGEGGMGVVYRAQDTRLDRNVAIKVVRPEAAASRERRERFVREAQAASALNHPHIIIIHDIDRDVSDGAERDFIVMEYVDGTSLDKLLGTGPLRIDEALRYAIQVAGALGAAHVAGIIHRDVKPANVMVSKTGDVKLVDFGLAKLAEGDSSEDGPTLSAGLRTEHGAVLGTPSYMSPEQAEGHPVDCRTDVFSFGSMLYEMLTGRRPFPGDSHVSIRKAVLTTTPTAPRSTRSEVPADLERVVLRCLEKEREARYPSASELLRDLERVGDRVKAGQGPWRRPRVVIPAGLALVAALSVASWLWVRSSRERWARLVALPEVARLNAEDKNVAAYRLAQQALPYLAGDREAQRLWESLTWEYSLHTDPEGALVSWKDYAEPQSAWEVVGRTPLEKVRLPSILLALLRWRVEKAGFQPLEIAPTVVWDKPLTLRPAGSTPKDMVFVPGGREEIEGKSTERDGFWLDLFEVTNRQFQAFVEVGGYRSRDYWKEPFVEEGHEVPWEEAVKKLVDRTGRPGPATWEVGSPPAGEEDYPVRGVSWYEASAFAQFAGKSLPTVHHWFSATDQYAPPTLLLLSNFDKKGPARVGSHQGLGPFGTYDMAGNVKEWCSSASGAKRYILGGAWDEPVYMYQERHAAFPFERRENYGFRCARYVKPPPPELTAPVERFSRDYSHAKPVDDATFAIFRSLYAYDRTALAPTTETMESHSPHWRMEKITMNAAYGGERLIAYLFLPANASPPYQTVVYFPGSDAQELPRLLEPELGFFDFVIRSGRAVLHPIYKDTYERRLRQSPPWPSRAFRDLQVQQLQDLGRSVDYLVTRPDIDAAKLAYYGFSWGASMGPIATALDSRFKASILLAGGFEEGSDAGMPEVDQFNFAPRVTIPTLMLNGRDDFVFPLEFSQKPMFRFLGTKAGDKSHVLFDGGHIPPRVPLVKPTLDWLDRYLGPVATGK